MNPDTAPTMTEARRPMSAARMGKGGMSWIP